MLQGRIGCASPFFGEERTHGRYKKGALRLMTDQSELPVEPERRGERLPWLQRIEVEKPPRTGLRFGRLLLGAGMLVVAAVAIAFFAIKPGHRPGGDEFGDGLAVDNTDRALLGGAEPQNVSSSAPSPPARRARRPSGRPTPVPAARTTRRQFVAGTDVLGGRPVERAATRRNAARLAALAPTRIRVAERPGSPRTILRNGHFRRREAMRVIQPLSGPVVQLGAYGSAEAAECAWQRLSASPRFSGSPHRIERAVVRGRTYYRLRAAVRQVPRTCTGRGNRCFLVESR
jgi:hypothetical protein